MSFKFSLPQKSSGTSCRYSRSVSIIRMCHLAGFVRPSTSAHLTNDSI